MNKLQDIHIPELDNKSKWNFKEFFFLIVDKIEEHLLLASKAAGIQNVAARRNDKQFVQRRPNVSAKIIKFNDIESTKYLCHSLTHISTKEKCWNFGYTLNEKVQEWISGRLCNVQN